MSPSIQVNEHFNMQANTQPCSCSCIVACSYACMQSDMQSGVQAGMHDISVKQCLLGLSNPQINIISIIKDSRLPLSYQHISDILANVFKMPKSADAVRGYINRLRRNGFIHSKYATLGCRRGNIYTIMPLACSHIPMHDMQTGMQTGTQLCIQQSMYPAMQSEPSILKEKIDSNLSILNKAKMHLESLSEDDIKFHWENLSEQGFGTNQIRQIIIRLAQVDIGLENIMQGLTHAEWELEHEQMKDKHGNIITSPTSWVFKILAKQGYYPRPKNYISPIEQAEIDALKEAEATKEAREAHKQAALNEWLSSLSSKQKNEILTQKDAQFAGSVKMPDDIFLKIYFGKIIWNDQQKPA